MKIDNEQAMKDLRSIVGIHCDYATSEPFIEGMYDLRIQKIGKKIRVFKRTGMSWKTNDDYLAIEEITVTPETLSWITEASNLNGEQMDIMTLDAVVSTDNEDDKFILEANGCSSGIPYLTEEQDQHAIVCLCVKRLHELRIQSKSSIVDNEKNKIEKELKLTNESLLLNLKNELEQSRINLDEANQFIERLKVSARNSNLPAASNKHRFSNKMIIVVTSLLTLGLTLLMFHYDPLHLK